MNGMLFNYRTLVTIVLIESVVLLFCFRLVAFVGCYPHGRREPYLYRRCSQEQQEADR